MSKPLDPENPGKFSSSLVAGLAMLTCFTPEHPVRGIADMADELDLGRSTTHRYATTLVTLGYLEQDPSRKYRLSPRSVQTAPVVPPGAFPNGTPGTQYEGAEVSPIGLKIAEEKAVQTWQHTEAERQKQKEEETLGELQKCRAEGGCGAGPGGDGGGSSGGGRPGIEGGGEAEGSGATAASVPLCEVKWKMDEFSPGVLTSSAGFFCKHTVAHFELQFQIWGHLPGEPFHKILSTKPPAFSHTDGEEGLIVGECVQGEIYTGWIWGRSITSSGSTFQSYGGQSIQKAETWTCEGNNSEIEQDSIETW